VSPAPEVLRGSRALRRLLREQTFDLRRLDVEGFRRWLDAHLARWQDDPVFAQRVRVRDLRRDHPELRRLEREERHAREADAASPEYDRLVRLERELAGTHRAVAGLSAALAGAAPEQRDALRRKLGAFGETRQRLEQEQETLTASSPPRQALRRLREELHRLRAAIGLDAEEARLEELQRQRGRRSGHSGASFEERAVALTRDFIVPDVVRRPGDDRLRLLRGVTLAAARVELDQLLVRTRPGRPVEVLAVVEVKRNVNDLAHGFRLRRENLAWLTGARDYDPGAYRTARFRDGHFDREALHEQEGEIFRFDPTSFRRFRRDETPDGVPGRLYFVTRPGSLWGVSTAALARIQARVADDERWQPGSGAYLGRLLDWCRSLAEPVESPDVLDLYASTPRRGRQVLLAGGV
jgi:hypothetical protein